MLLMENCIITACFLYFLVFFTSNTPPTPPSFAAMRNKTSITQGMKEDFKTLMRNRNFVYTMISYVLIFSIYSSFGVVVSLIFIEFGAFEISLFAMLFVLVGAISCFGYGKYLDKTSSYLKTLKFILIGTAA